MFALSQETINFLESLPNSELISVLSKAPHETRISALAALSLRREQTATTTERDTDSARKRDKRSETARINIPECVNPKRREQCLLDPERFLRTYMPKKFRQQFGTVHSRIIQTIHDRASTGGKKAVAAPRGRGKSTIVKGMLIYATAAELVRFIVPICATTNLAGRIYRDYRNEWGNNDTLLADFPEICAPVRHLEGAPQRAARQHVDGHLTHINWSSTDFLRLPRVPGNANEYMKSQGREWSPFGGVKMAFAGLDAAFRGMNIDDDRPDCLIIDDPETRESAKSLQQIEDRIEIIEKDIEGLEGQDKPLAMVMVTTLQNTYCVSAQFTDPEQKPAWEGERYGWIQSWPMREDLWNEYIAIRKADQARGDRHGMCAVEFYLDHFEEMNAGVVMLADNFKAIKIKDGRQAVHSAIQEAYNKIADTSLAAFKSEYQNDPDDAGEEFRVKIDPHTVIGCQSDFDRNSVCADASIVVAAVDVRKAELHYVRLASGKTVKNQICDYDVVSHGTSETTVEQAEYLILDGLRALSGFLNDTPLIDCDKTSRTIDLMLIDKGWLGSWKEDGQKKTWAAQPVEQFCMESGLRRFLPAKGAPNYRSPAPADHVIVGDNWHMNRGVGAERACTEVIWNAEHWHALVEDLFSSIDASEKFQLFTAGSGVHKGHERLSQHIREGAQDLLELKRRGTSSRKQRNRRDHWWDAIAMALVARSIEQWFRENLGSRKPKPAAAQQKTMEKIEEIGAR